MVRLSRWVWVWLMVAALLPASVVSVEAASTRPIVIGHRGASGYLPEHTLAAYALAIEMGADFIEPDLVSTKDGILVARHENDISGTTNVADHPEFAGRRTIKTIDGVALTGWFTEDFTLADSIALGRQIGIYPETKHPTYFASLGLSLEEPLVAILHRNGYEDRNAPVFIQSFEVVNLKKLRQMTVLPLVQVIDAQGKPYDLVASGDARTYADLTTPAELVEIARYAQGIGTAKALVIPRDSANKLMGPTNVVRDAHRAGLLVHIWTLRNENNFLPEELRLGDPQDPSFLRLPGNTTEELMLFFHAGVDGMFSDFPATAAAVRNALFR